MFRRGGRFAWATIALVALTFFVTGGLAQVMEEDPRNTSDDYFDALNGAKCFAHHGGEGFQPFGFNLVENFAQLPLGETVPLTMRIRHNSGIGQTIQQIAVVVNTTKAPNVVVVTEDLVPPVAQRSEVELESGAEAHVEKWPVMDGAADLFVAARAVGEPLGSQVGLGQGQLDLVVSNALGDSLPVQGGPFYKSLKMSGDELRDSGAGEYRLSAAWTSQVDATMPVELVVMVNYTQTQTEFIFRVPADQTLRAEGDTLDVVIPVIVNSAEPGVLDFRIQAVAYWPHQATDGAPRDDGLYYRFLSMKLRGGDQLIRVDSAFAPQPVGASVDLYNLFTRVLGFVAALLIPMSMLTGGIFGKGSRRWLNKVTGGAKKRVLWHSAMSWMIIGVASFHFILALIEAKFVWTKGLFWGGVGWALLISLGFTGYYQVRMIKRWNYKVWRHTHLWSAVTVLVFTLVHLTVDGSDLAAVREMLPDWFSRLSWP